MRQIIAMGGGEVSGSGKTRSMLALWREWELDRRLFKAYQASSILAGTSAAAHFIDERLTWAVSSQPAARVYRIYKVNGVVQEEALETRCLEKTTD